MTTVVSVRTEDSTIEKLDEIAASEDRNRNWVINEAINQYLELHEWQLEHIKKGIADTDAGHTLTLEEVRARIYAHHAAKKLEAESKVKRP
jgi:predicted transcriptional regulator